MGIGSGVSVENCFISGPCGEDRRVPGRSSDSVGVSVEDSQSLHLVDVPDLNFSRVGSEGEVRTFRCPGDGGG